MMRQITEDDRTMVNNCLRFIAGELEKRTKNIIGNPNEENLDLLSKDLHAYRQVRILADRAKVDSKKYDEKVNGYILQLTTRGITIK